MIFLLLGPTIFLSRRRDVAGVSLTLTALYLFQVVFSTMDAAFLSFTKGIWNIVVFTMTYIVFAFGMKKWMRSIDDVNRLLKATAVAAALFVAATSYQALFSLKLITQNLRLMATTANPQFAAAYIALMLPVVAYLLIRKGESHHFRVFLSILLGVLIVFLLWTAARMGAVVAAVGLLLLFRLRVGRFIVTAVISTVVVLIVMQIFADSLPGAARLFRLGDDRTGAWMIMWHDFLDRPLIGKAGLRSGGSESSYFLTAAQYRIAGLIPMFLVILAVLRDVVFLTRVRRFLGKDGL